MYYQHRSANTLCRTLSNRQWTVQVRRYQDKPPCTSPATKTGERTSFQSTKLRGGEQFLCCWVAGRRLAVSKAYIIPYPRDWLHQWSVCCRPIDEYNVYLCVCLLCATYRTLNTCSSMNDVAGVGPAQMTLRPSWAALVQRYCF